MSATRLSSRTPPHPRCPNITLHAMLTRRFRTNLRSTRTGSVDGNKLQSTSLGGPKESSCLHNPFVYIKDTKKLPPPPPPPPHLATTKTRSPADTPIYIYIYKPTGKRNDKKTTGSSGGFCLKSYDLRIENGFFGSISSVVVGEIHRYIATVASPRIAGVLCGKKGWGGIKAYRFGFSGRVVDVALTASWVHTRIIGRRLARPLFPFSFRHTLLPPLSPQ